MDTQQQVEVVDDFLADVIEAIAETSFADNNINSKLILNNIGSAVLMDTYKLYKTGASKEVILTEVKEAIQVYKNIQETLEGILQSSTELLADDPNNYAKQETTNVGTD